MLHNATCFVLKLTFNQINLIQAQKEKSAYYLFHGQIPFLHLLISALRIKYQNKVSISLKYVDVLRKCKGVMVIQLSERMSNCLLK